MKPPPGRRALAWWIAIAADALQLGLFPLLGGVGYAAADAIDVIVGGVLVWLLGWHVAFLPTFVAEVIPFVDLFPTWTAAVWFVTRKRTAPVPTATPPLPPPPM